MTNTLQKKLNEILTDKNTNLLPENLKKGIRCLGIDGTLEASTTTGGVKQFNTVEEMNASTGNKDGDLAVVYRNEMKPVSNGDTITSITFPKTVVFTEAITSEYRGRLGNSSEPRIYLDIRLNASYCDMSDMDGTIPEITYTSTDGITYTRTDTNADTYETGETTVRGLDEHICKFIQTGKSIFDGVYKYSESNWSLAPTQLTTTADYVYEKEFYGKNGVETGTLTKNISYSFADINAEIYNKIQKAYAAMEPKILTDTDKAVDENIYFIPVNAQGEPLWDTSAVTNMSSMFTSCTNLKEIPLLNTSNVTTMYGIFSGCTNLTTIPLLDTSKVTNTTSMFARCTNLTTIPLLDISKVTETSSMFSDCTNLEEVPVLDISQATTVGSMFKNCTKLSDNSLNNILATCISATKLRNNVKTLSVIGLTSEQANRCKTLSNYSAFTAAGWTTGY